MSYFWIRAYFVERRERKAGQGGLRARIAELEAQREGAEARVRHEMAALHKRGMADHELGDVTRLEDFRAGRDELQRTARPTSQRK